MYLPLTKPEKKHTFLFDNTSYRKGTAVGKSKKTWCNFKIFWIIFICILKHFIDKVLDFFSIFSWQVHTSFISCLVFFWPASTITIKIMNVCNNPCQINQMRKKKHFPFKNVLWEGFVRFQCFENHKQLQSYWVVYSGKGNQKISKCPWRDHAYQIDIFCSLDIKFLLVL